MTTLLLELRERFITAVKRGTGDAVLILKTYPALQVDDVVLKACSRNHASDPQSEGHRAFYASLLVAHSHDPEAIARKVVRELSNAQADDVEFDQLLALCALLHARGLVAAKDVVLASFARIPDPWNDIECGQDLIRSLGLEAAVHIAEHMGGLLLDDPGLSQRLSFYSKRPKVMFQRQLVARYDRSPAIARYLQQMDSGVIHTWKVTKKRSYRFYKERLSSPGSIGPIMPRVGPDRKVLAKLFRDLLTSADPIRQERLVALLRRYRIPGALEMLLGMARTAKARTRDHVYEALSHFSNPEVRALAMRDLTRGRCHAEAIGLLCKNYRKGDAEMIDRVIKTRRTTEQVHELSWPVLAVFTRNDDREGRKPLESLYYGMQCGIHRCDVVKLLWKRGQLSPSILREMQYDSYDGVRALHARIKSR